MEVQRFVALREGHWVGIEVVCNSQEHTCRAVFLQVPPRDQQFWQNFATDYVVPLGFRPIIIIDTNRTRPGMCGWELLHRWIIADLALPDAFHIPQQKRQFFDLILDESDQAWRTAGAPPMLRTFAANLRRLFLLVGGISYLQPCSAVSLGGMEGAASADSPMQAVDPWQIDDPWKSKKKQVKQSKWEDLQLQADHPFVVKDKTPVPFVQKQQLSTNRGGIAFVSKGNLQSAKEVQPKEPCALLLPLIDPTDPLAKLQHLSGPFEVIVFDPALNHEYKTPCIPTRSFRRAGVCAWTLSFEKPPSVSKFSVQVNDKTFEVLLTPVTYKTPNKGKGKGKGQKGSAPANENLPPRGAVSKQIYTERNDRLEEQVGRLEQKHEHLSDKVDNQFSQVGDQLRQILQCVQPRHRDQGDTPPPVKHHRALDKQ